MSTLLLRLAAPLQSWGLDDKFERRGTAREPTKSGVIGLLAAALGLERDDDETLEQLNVLRFGVRIDQPGQLLGDFHTARVEGKPNPYVTRRYYLSDAVFLVGVEGDDEALLRSLEQALHHPVYPLFLGRRSCPPEGRLSLGLRDKTLETALREEPWHAGSPYQRQKKGARLTLVQDAQQPGMLRRRDLPLSFSQWHRKHTFRYVEDIPNAIAVGTMNQHALGDTEHDPFAELED
jgi:CRISPR system Cascade subunit CasD